MVLKQSCDHTGRQSSQQTVRIYVCRAQEREKHSATACAARINRGTHSPGLHNPPSKSISLLAPALTYSDAFKRHSMMHYLALLPREHTPDSIWLLRLDLSCQCYFAFLAGPASLPAFFLPAAPAAPPARLAVLPLPGFCLKMLPGPPP
jgi:hypothetical protein